MLLVIDLQEKLVPALHESERLVENASWLIRIAARMQVPIAATEQYPRGLGRSIELIRELLPETAFATKTHFSCVAANCMAALPGSDRQQIVIVGAETHVCVLQTALELLEEGKEVYVVADAVSSRRAEDRDYALARMRQEGARIVTREMVVFEWLREAGTPLFREVSRDFLKASKP